MMKQGSVSHGVRACMHLGPVAILVTVVGMGMCAVAGAAPPPTYTLIDLGTLGGTNSTGYGINASGQVTGSATLSGDQSTHAFIYRQGVMYDIGTPAGTRSAVGTAINASGQLSGNATDSTGKSVAWLYSNGSFVNLAPTDTQNDFAQAINDAGAVAGYAEGAPIVYDGTLHPLPFGFYAFANGINNAGQVAGAGQTGGPMNVEAAFIYDFKTGASVQFGGLDGALYLQANAINAQGTVAGTSGSGLDNSTADDLPEHAFLYDAGGIHDLGTLGGSTSEGLAINANNEIVGSSQIDGDNATHAFLYTDGAMVDLNTLLFSSALTKFVTLNSATGINDRGWVVANGVDSRTGQSHAYLLELGACDESADEIFERIIEQLDTQHDLGHLKRIAREARADYDARDFRITRYLIDELVDGVRRHEGRGIPAPLARDVIKEAELILDQVEQKPRHHHAHSRQDSCGCDEHGAPTHNWHDENPSWANH